MSYIFKSLLLCNVIFCLSVNISQAKEIPTPTKKPDYCKVMMEAKSDPYNVEYEMPEGVEYDDGEADIDVPKEIKFQLNIDVAKEVGIELPEGASLDGNIGEIKIDKQGDVYFNNKPLDKEVKVKLEEVCAK